MQDVIMQRWKCLLTLTSLFVGGVTIHAEIILDALPMVSSSSSHAVFANYSALC